MDWNGIMNIMLPPRNGIAPHQTSPFGPRKYEGKEFHYGVDFNYNVPGQSGINLTNPPVYSPIAGTVVAVGGSKGGVVIRDNGGLYHSILHMSSQSVAVGDPVRQGQPIGTMGGVGAPRGQAHVHYQISDSPLPGGKLVNPVEYWNPVPLPRPRPDRPDAASDATPAEAQASATPRQLYLTDRFYKSRTGAPLYQSDRFVTDLKSAAAMRRTPLFDSDAVELGVKKPAAEIGVEKPAAAGFNERFQSFTPADGSRRTSTDDTGGNARPWSWRDTVIDPQNRLIQPVGRVDWERIGSGQQQEFSPPQPESYGDTPAGERASDPGQIREADAVREEGQEQATDRAAGYRPEAVAAHLARIDQAKQRIPDFDQVIRSGGQVQVAPGVADEILNSEKSALLQYHLAGNPGTLEELNGLSGKNLARAVGRLEGRLHLPPAGTVTEASPPLSDVRDSAAPMFDPHTTDDMDAFANWLREDQARRRRA